MEAPRRRATLKADWDWVEGCRGGDLDTYESLYLSQSGRMKSVAFNLLGNLADAEDAVQEAFLKIYRSIGGFRGRCAFTTWIYRILVNTCYDLRRSRRHADESKSLDDNESPLFDPALTTSATHPLRLALHKGLAQLNERNRAVFLLFKAEGFTHAEVAEILDIPEGTSKSALFEAKQALRKILPSPNASMRSTG